MTKRGVAGLLAALALSGCITTTGTSSSAMRKNFLNSYFVKNLEVFYPEGSATSATDPIPNLDKTREKVLGSQVSQLAVAVAKLHENRKLLLAKTLGVEAFAKPTGQVSLVNNSIPIADTTFDNRARFSYMFLQALFRGAMLEDAMISKASPNGRVFYALSDNNVSFTFDDNLNPLKATQEQENSIKAIRERVAEVKSMRTHSVLFDVLSGGDSFSDMSDAVFDYNYISMSHSGAMLFLLAHEQGHVVLNHRATLSKINDPAALCAAKLSMERQADLYALLLLSQEFGDTPSVPTMNTGAVTGYRSFFQYSYPLTGFSSSGDQCSYEPNKVRFEKLAIIDKNLRDSAAEKWSDLIAKAFNALAAETDQGEKK